MGFERLWKSLFRSRPKIMTPTATMKAVDQVVADFHKAMAATKRCGHCHQVLRNSKSIQRGYGPKCWRTIRQESEQEADIILHGDGSEQVLGVIDAHPQPTGG